MAQVYEHARSWSEYALPKTHAYHEIWLDEEMVAGGEEKETMYGDTYLPRKFKVGFALPPVNDVDIFSQDLGFVAVEENGQLAGYNVTVGGGQGMAHGQVATFPRLADVLGFIAPDQVNAIGEAVLTTQRDFGDRTNRRHARLKYTIEDRGIEWFRGEVERRSGITFGPARAFNFTTIEDPLGWHECADGTWFYGLHILSGRIRDREGWPMKTALREIAEIHGGDFRLTPSQNLTISGVTTEQKAVIDGILAKHGLSNENVRSGLRRNALSCVALPTCGLAVAESERVLPGILDKLENVFDEAGLREDAISLRVTGCPNGCARPYLAEIGFVGRAANKYALFLGAAYNGTRLNRLVSPSITIDDAVTMLRPIIKQYSLERNDGEGFGDYCDRADSPRRRHVASHRHRAGRVGSRCERARGRDRHLRLTLFVYDTRTSFPLERRTARQVAAGHHALGHRAREWPRDCFHEFPSRTRRRFCISPRRRNRASRCSGWTTVTTAQPRICTRNNSAPRSTWTCARICRSSPPRTATPFTGTFPTRATRRR